MNRLGRTARLAGTFFVCLCLTYGVLEPGFYLAIKLHAGDSIVEHRYENDRIDWTLPQKRLQHFQRAGVIVNEERHITSTAHAAVISSVKGTALLKGVALVSSLDVPRHRVTRVEQPFTVMITARNDVSPDSGMGIEDAAMLNLPAGQVRLGARWQTRKPVTTTLGSGSVVFDHRVDSVDNGLVRVEIHGHGEITGTEYHLPKLLPGSISMQGAAWYDLASGLVTQESYSIHDTLIKPAQREAIGFDEWRSVDVSTRRI